MPVSDLKDWLSVIAAVVSLGTLIYAWMTRTGREAHDKVEKLEDRVARLEGEFNHMPDRDSVHRMELSLSELRGELKAMAERLTPVASIADRLQEFLLEAARHK